MIHNQKGMVMVVVLMVTTLLMVMIGHGLLMSRLELKKTVNLKQNVQALYFAEMAAHYATVALAFTSAGVIVADTTSILGAHSTGQVVITPDGGDPDLATIDSTATYFSSKEHVRIGVKRTFPVFPGIRGALTTNGPTLTNGTINIDGRDHTIDGDLIPNSGGPGLVTGDRYNQDGDSTVGGTFDGTDYDLSSPADPNVVQEGVEGLGLTPDAVVGLYEGTLKNISKSGVAGSQYVTDPAELVWPLSGITYIELPTDDPWWIVAGDTIFDGGTGIVVVHNPETGAIVKNMNQGTFKGLIIADDIVHIHMEIIGAVVSLTPDPSLGNSIGNGTGNILFSTAALSGFDFAIQVTQISWLEP